MNVKNTFQNGDHVWWGDPATPFSGVIVTFSANGRTAFVKNDTPIISARIDKYYEFQDVDRLRLVAPCGAYLNAGQDCTLDCPHCSQGASS